MSAPHTFLDEARTAQLRDFFVDEARDTRRAGSRVPGRSQPRRRAIAIGFAAVVLACVVLTVSALTGGYGPTHTESAVAVTAKNGWTTVRLGRSDVSPDAVVADLRAAGIAARVVWQRVWPPVPEPVPIVPEVVTWSVSTGAVTPKGISMMFSGPAGARVLRFRSDTPLTVVVHGYRPG